jgi:hypothetical protein
MRKDQSYDYTAKDRMKNCEKKIREDGLSNLKVVCTKVMPKLVGRSLKSFMKKEILTCNAY